MALIYILKTLDKKITGVLHHNASQKQYNLRRYVPPKELADLVELFWFVDWNLGEDNSHTQQNLPEPNFHLVFEGDDVKLLGPVSKRYQYTMRTTGRIVGVKFRLGMLEALLPQPTSYYIDQTIPADNVFSGVTKKILSSFIQTEKDERIINRLIDLLSPHARNQTKHQQMINQWVELIKTEQSITTVSALSTETGMSERSLQRLFNQYIGLSPKWLIRKYRLHHALTAIDENQQTPSDIVAQLGYVDQSHLIKDFKVFLGVTPKRYMMK